MLLAQVESDEQGGTLVAGYLIAQIFKFFYLCVNSTAVMLQFLYYGHLGLLFT